MAEIFRVNIARASSFLDIKTSANHCVQDNPLEPTTLNYLLKWVERILEHVRTPGNMCDSRSTFILDAMALNSNSSFFERVAMKLSSTELEIAESKRKERQLDVEDSARREQEIDKELELARLKNGQGEVALSFGRHCDLHH